MAHFQMKPCVRISDQQSPDPSGEALLQRARGRFLVSTKRMGALLRWDVPEMEERCQGFCTYWLSRHQMFAWLWSVRLEGQRDSMFLAEMEEKKSLKQPNPKGDHLRNRETTTS